MRNFIFFPPEASEHARHVDWILFGLLGVSAAIIGLVVALLLVFGIRYRRGSRALRGPLPEWVSRDVEIGWTVATLFAFIFIFWYAAASFLTTISAAPNALEIHVVGKQWMWKIEHANGVREINELHAPVGIPVKLVMISQDVIHSFFLPALRIKQDVLPGRYTSESFTADKPGTYSLFCAEYCGTDHARMGGQLVIMSKPDYQKWLDAQPAAGNLAGKGRQLFVRLGCAGCHFEKGHRRAPDLAGVYGSYVELADGRTVRADEAYLRDSILQPKRDIVAGYTPIMPSFEGTVSEDQIFELVAFIKSYAGDAEKTQ
jgi:cytochrome c oxidase subunit 2